MVTSRLRNWSILIQVQYSFCKVQIRLSANSVQVLYKFGTSKYKFS